MRRWFSCLSPSGMYAAVNRATNLLHFRSRSRPHSVASRPRGSDVAARNTTGGAVLVAAGRLAVNSERTDAADLSASERYGDVMNRPLARPFPCRCCDNWPKRSDDEQRTRGHSNNSNSVNRRKAEAASRGLAISFVWTPQGGTTSSPRCQSAEPYQRLPG